MDDVANNNKSTLTILLDNFIPLSLSFSPSQSGMSYYAADRQTQARLGKEVPAGRVHILPGFYCTQYT